MKSSNDKSSGIPEEMTQMASTYKSEYQHVVILDSQNKRVKIRHKEIVKEHLKRKGNCHFLVT